MAVIKKPTDGPTDSKKERHHYLGFNLHDDRYPHWSFATSNDLRSMSDADISRHHTIMFLPCDIGK